ncbi:MAG: hypothetical protein IJ770_00805 [Alphaproteobacteria bacterium]|nr:hypothetical protein [Alphaproteobacteria bacterium]
MRSIIAFLRKYNILWLSPSGLFVALAIGYAVYALFGFTPISYIFGVIAFSGLSTLLYFDWGYKETDAGAMGNYSGVVITYFCMSACACFGAFMTFDWLIGVTCSVICALFGVFLVVPVIKFFQSL